MRADGMHGCMRWQERAWKMQPYLVDRMYHRGGLFCARACMCAKGQTDSMRRRKNERATRNQVQVSFRWTEDEMEEGKVNKDATRCDRALRLRKDRRDRDQNA